MTYFRGFFEISCEWRRRLPNCRASQVGFAVRVFVSIRNTSVQIFAYKCDRLGNSLFELWTSMRKSITNIFFSQREQVTNRISMRKCLSYTLLTDPGFHSHTFRVKFLHDYHYQDLSITLYQKYLSSVCKVRNSSEWSLAHMSWTVIPL